MRRNRPATRTAPFGGQGIQMEIFAASRQWATRPDDERFDNLQELYQATLRHANQAGQATRDWRDLRVEAAGDDVVLVGKADRPARLTHYSFGQLSSRVGAPAGYLRELPATVAAQNLNYGLKHRSPETQAQLLMHVNGGYVLRAVTSTRYDRIWNYEVVQRLMEFSDRFDLVPAQQTFNWGGEGGRTQLDQLDPNADKALYASDHDMFAFVMSLDRVIQDPTGSALRRGLIVVNSEVGAASLKIMGFLFRDVCANHIIWGAQDVAEISLRHVGDIRQKFDDARVRVRRYLDGAASLEEARFEELQMPIAGTKEEVLDKLFGLRSIGLPRKTLAAGYDAVVPEEDGDPNSRWGMVQGLTRHSQEVPYADERTQLDRAAGKILEVEF